MNINKKVATSNQMGSENLPVTRFKRHCLLCSCENGICEYLPLKNNPSRYFYKCLAPNCSKNSFFKYENEVSKEDKFIDVPYCGGCNAGLCRVRLVEDGYNAGRILFSCTIKEGHGSCGYKVYQDELEIMHQVNPSVTVPPSPLTTRNDINPQNVGLFRGDRPSEKGPDSDHPSLTSGNFGTCAGSNKIKQSLRDEEKQLGESSSLCKTLRDGNLEGASPLLNSIQAERLVAPAISTPIQKSPLRPVNLSLESIASPNRIKNHLGSRTSILSPCNKICDGKVSRKIRKLQWQEDLPGESNFSDKSLCDGDNKGHRPLSDSRSTVQAGSLVNSGHSSHGVGSSSLSPNKNVEVSGMGTSCNTPIIPSREEPSGMFSPNSCTSQLVSTAIEKFAEDLQNSLLSRLETMSPQDHEAMNQEAGTAFSVLDSIFIDYRNMKHQVTKLIESARTLHNRETEFLSSETDLLDQKNQLEILKRKCADASQELEDTSELHAVREVERNAAKAAFEQARSQLRR